MKMKNNKKGFTYLLVVSFLIATIIIVYLSVDDYGFQDKQGTYEKRILAMNEFVKNFNQDVGRATYIASFRTLLSLEDYVAVNGKFLNDTETQFQETVYYGTINGTEAELMNGSSFEDYLARVNIVANSIGLKSFINVTNISLSQSSPFEITVVLSTKINLTDNNHIASWFYEKNFTTKIPIYDLRDPLYSTFTFNRVPNTVRVLNATELVNGTNTTELQKLINESYYLENPLAPSFLQRFENNITPNPYGIESIVNVGLISAQDVPVCEDCVKVDYLYFNGIDNNKLCNVQNVPASTYFVITEDRNATYDLGSLTYSTVCP